MDPYQETFETWNLMAGLYQDKFMDLDLYNETYDFFCQQVEKPNASLLDVGCGPGNITRFLLSKKLEFDILGIDTAPNMVALARQNNPTAKFEIMDCRMMGSIPQKFDGIVCGFCLPYLSPTEVERFINDCSILIHENGILFISFVEGPPSQSGFKTGSNGHRVYFHYHPLDGLKKQLSENGFEDLKIFRVEYYQKDIHTILVYRKTAKLNPPNKC